jgi:hypothetical protein
MVWMKGDSGTWTDEFDGAEKVFYGMSQAFKRHNREHGSVYAICRIRCTPPPSAGPGLTLVNDSRRHGQGCGLTSRP